MLYKAGPISSWPGVVLCDDPKQRQVQYFENWPTVDKPLYLQLIEGELQDYLRQGYWAVFDNDLEVDVGL